VSVLIPTSEVEVTGSNGARGLWKFLRHRLRTRKERSTEPARIGVDLKRAHRSVSGRFAGWPAIVGVAALLVAGCGDGSPRSPAERGPGGSPASGPRGGFDAAAARRLQGTLDRVRREQQIPGAAAAVLVPGEGVWVGAAGFADVHTREPVRLETLFEIASVTKTFVAALVLKLAEDGVLGLDDRLSKWVPEFPGGRGITLRQLLNHTAGTDDFVSDGRFLAAQRRRGLAAAWTPQQLLRYVPAPLAKPGERWNYSNTNYLLLGLAIERATHSTVGRELHRRVLPRATFDRIAFQGEERPRGAVAVGYRQLDADPELEPTPNNPYIPSTSEATSAWASGNLLASAEDLARAGDRLFRGELLSARSRRAMTQWVKALFKPPEYGLGLAHDELAGEEVWGHSGDITGFHADLWYLPKSRVTVAALINYQAGGESPDKQRLAEGLISDVRALGP
jgi:D-alanyl-D-alanine carboxypeptidase